MTPDMHAKMSTLLLIAGLQVPANGLPPHVRDHTIVFATMDLTGDELDIARLRVLGAWCARTASLCVAFMLVRCAVCAV